MLEVKENKINFTLIFQNALKKNQNYTTTHSYSSYYDDMYDDIYGDCYGGFYDESDWWEAYEKMKHKDKKDKKTSKKYLDNDGELIEIEEDKKKDDKKSLHIYNDNNKLIRFYPEITNKNSYKFFTSLFEFDNFLEDDVIISDADANYMMQTDEFCTTIKKLEDGTKKLIVEERFDQLKFSYDYYSYVEN